MSAKVTKGTEVEGTDYLFIKVQKLIFYSKSLIVLIISSLYIYVVYKLSYISIFNFHDMQWSTGPLLQQKHAPPPPQKNWNPLVRKIFNPIPP